MSKKAEEAAMTAYPPIATIPKMFTENGMLYDPNTVMREVFIKGYEQAEKDTIERACKWLFSHLPILLDYYDEDIHEKADRSEFIKLFRTQMEDEQ